MAGNAGRVKVSALWYIITTHAVAVTEGLVPALRRRGLMRTEYAGRTLPKVLHESWMDQILGNSL